MRIALVSFSLGLASLAPAQSYITSPSGYLTTESPGSAYFFGGDSFGRVMFFDGEVGNSLMLVKEVAYRPDTVVALGMGRTWSNISLRVSDCDVDKATTVFSANPTSSPALVFSSSVTWPTIPAKPSGAWTIRFPFTNSWIYTGSKDICLDYDFEGGTLLNQSQPWWKMWPYAYVLDGYDVQSVVIGKETRFTSNPWCIDSRGRGNLFQLYFVAFDRFYIPPRQYSHLLESTAITAPGAVGFTALGVAGSSRGFVFPGVTCEKIYVDFSKPVALFPRTADLFGRWDVRPSANRYIPYNAAITGAVVWGQAAWSDTGNGALLFTQGATNTVPRLPKEYRRKVLHQPDNTLKYGSGNWPARAYFPTITRYTR